MTQYKTIEHTADIGIEVQGPDLPGLFINAARGLVDFIVDVREVGEKQTRKISLDAGIREELLVKWLEEILYLFEVKDLIVVDFDIKKLENKKLEADVTCIPFSPKIQKPKHQIKAVTYHNLTIREERDRFSATIIFDI